MGTRLLLAAAVASIASAVAADGPPQSPSARVAGCGHVAELEAAKAALAQGDRAAALQHLEAADKLLQRCEREGIPDQAEPEPEPEPTQTGDAGPGGSGGAPV